MKIKMFLLISFICIEIAVSNAQAIETNLYPSNYVYINPAFSHEGNLLGLSVRTQKAGIKYGLVSYEGYIKNINMGIGFIGSATNEFDIQGRTNSGFFVNYKIDISDNFSFRIASKTSIQSETIDYSYFQATDSDDPLLNPQASESQTRLLQDLALKLQYKKIFGGITFSNLFNAQFNQLYRFDYPLDLKRKCNALIGYDAGPFTWLNLSTSIFVADLSDLSVTDLNSILTFKKKFIGGISYRTSYSELRINAGVNIIDRIKWMVSVYELNHSKDNFHLETWISVRL